MHGFHATDYIQQLATRHGRDELFDAKETYQFKPADILVVPQVISKVHVIHEFEHESRRILWGGIYSDEWYDVLALETTTRQCLFIEPLPVDFQLTGHTL